VFVSSADLSHVGPQFGDQAPLDEKRRHAVEQFDRELLGEFIGGGEPFLAHVAKTGNANRWCSIGNMYVTAVCAPHRTREMVKYEQSVDPNGAAMISSAALALLA